MACSADSVVFSENDAEQQELPAAVNIRIDSALIRPWDPQQELWDDSQKISAQDIEALAAAFDATNPYAKVLGLLAEVPLSHWAPPDPYGHVSVLTDGSWSEPTTLSTPDDNDDNTLAPVFDVTLDSIPLDDDLRVRVTLIDEDDFLSGDDDPIGNIELSSDDIIAALDSGGVVAIATEDQGLGTILFVSISVTPAAETE